MKVSQIATGLATLVLSLSGVSAAANTKSVCKKDAFGKLILKDGCVDIDKIAYENSGFSAASTQATKAVAPSSSAGSIKAQSAVVLDNGGEGSAGSSGNDQLKSDTINYDQYVNNNTGQLNMDNGQQADLFLKAAPSTMGTTSVYLDTRVGTGGASK